MDCNQLAVDIDNEIVLVYNFLRDKYKTKFPELESLVHHPLDYARVVQVRAGGSGRPHCRRQIRAPGWLLGRPAAAG